MTSNSIYANSNRATSFALLTTELNALATAAGTVAGPEIDNSASGWQSGDFYFHIASSSLAFTTASFVSVYALMSNQGATYTTYTSGATPIISSNTLMATIYVNPKTQVANVVEEWCPALWIPASKFKTVLISSLGVTLPATLNTLTFYPTPTTFGG